MLVSIHQSENKVKKNTRYFKGWNSKSSVDFELKTKKDILLVVAIGLIVFFSCIWLDILSFQDAWFEIGEVVIATFFSFICLIWFGFTRCQDANYFLKKCLKTQVEYDQKEQAKIIDARGFKPDGINHDLGLIGMRERIKNLGGPFEISSKANRGVDLPILAPLKDMKVNNYECYAD